MKEEEEKKGRGGEEKRKGRGCEEKGMRGEEE